MLGLESTALVPGDDRRIVELAIIQVDAQGEVLNRWQTLVNPGQKLGLLGAHGLTDDDVCAAPSFAQIADRVSARLAGRVVVAHNARFVVDLLLDELDRAGAPAPALIEPVCTMQLARDLLPGAGRTLADCGAAYDLDTAPVDIDAAGTVSPAGLCAGALGTADATTALLHAYLQSAGCLNSWTEALDRAAALPWPVSTGRGGVPGTRPRSPQTPLPAAAAGLIVPRPPFRTRAPLRLPDFTGPDEQLDYLALLDRCLVDGTLLTYAPAHPLSPLTELARRTHIDAVTRTRLHHSYAEELLRAALADGALTPLDRTELVAVTRLLAADSDAELAQTALTERIESITPHAALILPAGPGAPVTLIRGDIIVLTESLTRGTAAWAREIVARGFTVAAAVTLRTRLVVAGDPTALSGKTAKARDYGIPIVSEFALRSVMGID